MSLVLTESRDNARMLLGRKLIQLQMCWDLTKTRITCSYFSTMVLMRSWCRRRCVCGCLLALFFLLKLWYAKPDGDGKHREKTQRENTNKPLAVYKYTRVHASQLVYSSSARTHNELAQNAGDKMTSTRGVNTARRCVEHQPCIEQNQGSFTSCCTRLF